MLGRATAILAAALALSAPGAALAQSAGDDQYRDPFAGEEQPDDAAGGDDPEASGGSGGAGGSGGGSTAAPAPTAQTAPVTTAPTATTAGETLPRTGADAWILAIAGVGLLAAGSALRRSVRV